MKRNYSKQIFALVLSALMLCASVVPVYANSAQTRFEGVDSTGAIMSEKESPIVVERELLTFDIGEFPQNYYREEDEYLAYGASVRAEYTFYNPSDYTVSARLLFPFGKVPSYAHGYYDEDGVYQQFVDTEKYDITVNGEVIDKKIRYTLSHSYEQFDLERDLALLSDGFVEDDFYTPELTVTKYTFRISEVDTNKYRAADAAIDVPLSMGNYRIYLPSLNGFSEQSDHDARIHTSVRTSDEKIELYIFGTPPSTLPEWKFYKNGGVKDSEEIHGKAELESTEVTTLEEFALSGRNEQQSAISEIDWYNATIAEIKSSAERTPNHPIVFSHSVGKTFDNNFMRWYEYEITLAPKERIVNAVNAPMYPSIDLSYEPDIYKYTYLLSPAKTWREFGELEIVINTPYYITDSGMDGFQKTENGYKLTLDGLPDGELSFTLSTSQKVKKQVSPYDRIATIIVITVAAVIIFVLSIAAGVVVLIALLVRRRKRSRRSGE